IDSADNLFVADAHWEQQTLTGSILKITPSGVRTTFASRLVAAMAFQRSLAPNPAPTATVIDFNSDGHPDLVLRNTNTRQTAIWYLNNNVLVGGDAGPILAAGWGLRAVGAFNVDSHS